MDIQNFLIQVLLFMPVFLFSLSVHEAAHAYVAYKLGDNTAKDLGRVTLNPIAHADPLGTIILPILGLYTGFLFGWGKPVPVDYRNLKNFKRDGAWISAAGPASNLVLAFVTALVIKYFPDPAISQGFGPITPYHLELFQSALISCLFLNLALCFFNLIPVQPLDGSKILFGVLPKGIAEVVDAFSTRFGMAILVVLIFTGALRLILWPPIVFVGKWLLSF